MDIVSKILKLREERQWTEYKLSQEAGISQSTLSNLVNRGNNPSLHTLEKVAQAFGLSLAQFFNTNDEEFYLSKEQKLLLSRWDHLDKRQREKVLVYIQGMLER